MDGMAADAQRIEDLEAKVRELEDTQAAAIREAVAQEREACAQEVESQRACWKDEGKFVPFEPGNEGAGIYNSALADAAAAIRARGQADE